MYNRYIRNDHGAYTHLHEEDAPDGFSPRRPAAPPPNPGAPGRRDAEETGQRRREEPPNGPEPFAPPPPPHRGGRRPDAKGASPFESAEGAADAVNRTLRRLLDRFHLFQEDADEELLFAIGLLLVL